MNRPLAERQTKCGLLQGNDAAGIAADTPGRRDRTGMFFR
jgi:hypothetical protein